MILPHWHEEPIDKQHDRERFDCGNTFLNDFLRNHARKSHEQGGAKTFLAISDDSNGLILGFYSLSPASIQYSRTPEIIRRKLARYDVPVFRLGRLAVDQTVQGQGLGGQLLLSAAKRCLYAASEVGGVALLIDAKNDRALNWYKSYGALPLEDTPLSLALPLSTLKAILLETNKF